MSRTVQELSHWQTPQTDTTENTTTFTMLLLHGW